MGLGRQLAGAALLLDGTTCGRRPEPANAPVCRSRRLDEVDFSGGGFLMVSFIVAQWLGIDLMHSMSAIGPVLIWELGVAAGTIYDAAWLTLGLIITLWASK